MSLGAQKVTFYKWDWLINSERFIRWKKCEKNVFEIFDLKWIECTDMIFVRFIEEIYHEIMQNQTKID